MPKRLLLFLLSRSFLRKSNDIHSNDFLSLTFDKLVLTPPFFSYLESQFKEFQIYSGEERSSGLNNPEKLCLRATLCAK